MGVLPLQFKEGTTAASLKLDGSETYEVVGLNACLKPQQDLLLRISYANGDEKAVSVTCRIDTPIEIDYYQHGGILPYVLRQLLSPPAPFASAELGFVGLSQVIDLSGSRWVVQQDLYLPIRHQAVLLRGGECNGAAKSFLVDLGSQTARETLLSLGYGVE